MAEAVCATYRTGQEDEAVKPLVRVDRAGRPVGFVQDGDCVIFYDIGSEHEAELTRAFITSSFPHFSRSPIQVHFATIIEHNPDLDVHVAFPVLDEYSHSSGNSGRVIQLAVSFRNCRISETQLDRCQRCGG